MATSFQTRQNERITIVDVLRGFALFGVLLGNFSGMLTNDVPDAIINSISTPFDHVLNSLHDIFIQNKFMTLFSMLFGYGFGVLIERAEKNNLNSTSFFIRRMFWLFVFGGIHLAFWAEDILHIYAMAGIFLLLFRKSSRRTVLVWSFFLMFVFPFAVRLYQQFILHNSLDYDALTKAHYTAIKYGTLRDVAVLNYRSYPQQWIYTLTELRDCSDTLGRFLFGYYVLRRQILVRLDDYSSVIRKIWKGSFVLLLLYIMLWLANYNIAAAKIWLYPFLKLGVFATTLFYSTSIILIFQKGFAVKLMEGLRNAGRMALTNYLTETMVYLIIFYNLGFGLLGEWPLRVIWAASFVLYLLQIIFSQWWLSKFLYGPMEWIWRQLTYQKRFPILKLGE